MGEIGIGLKQYHKGRAWILNNTTKAKKLGAKIISIMGPLWAKIGMGNTVIPQMPNNGPTN